MKYLPVYLLVALLVFLYVGYAPVREFRKIPVYEGNSAVPRADANYDSTRKNVVIIADHRGTEIFDLIAPYYLFQLTGRLNVFIVAKERKPIVVMKGFFTVPHYTFRELDSMHFDPDVLVIPNLSGTEKKYQDQDLLHWLRKNYEKKDIMLSVCAGSFTAGATGLYDGKPMTTHASDFENNRTLIGAPSWVQGVSYTRSGNLYSTAGVSNAVEGTLAVIRDLFGNAMIEDIMRKINYPQTVLKEKHASRAITLHDKITALKKVYFTSDPNIGVWLEEGIDELKLSAVLDAYHRTFPLSIKTFSKDGGFIRSRFGLIIIPSGKMFELKKLDELHIVENTINNNIIPPGTSLVHYQDDRYIFDQCLDRIQLNYGKDMEEVVRKLLDY